MLETDLEDCKKDRCSKCDEKQCYMPKCKEIDCKDQIYVPADGDYYCCPECRERKLKGIIIDGKTIKNK